MTYLLEFYKMSSMHKTKKAFLTLKPKYDMFSEIVKII